MNNIIPANVGIQVFGSIRSLAGSLTRSLAGSLTRSLAGSLTWIPVFAEITVVFTFEADFFNHSRLQPNG